MKQLISFTQIASNYIFYKLLGLLFLMSAIEAALFLWRLKESTYLFPLDQSTIYQSAHLTLIFGLFLILVLLLITLQGVEISGSHFHYTMMRLPHSERVLSLAWSVYYFLCLLLLFLTQIGLNFIFSLLYVKHMDAVYVNAQTLLINTYRIPLLHSLLPLSDPFGLIRNLLLLLALSLTAACFSFRSRHGKRDILHIFLSVNALVFLPASGTSTGASVYLFLLSAAALFYAAHQLFREVMQDEA